MRGIQRLRADKKAIPGFGHPQHAGGDPRANLLLELAGERGIDGPHVEMLLRDQGRAARHPRPRAADQRQRPRSRRSCSTSASRSRR